MTNHQRLFRVSQYALLPCMSAVIAMSAQTSIQTPPSAADAAIVSQIRSLRSLPDADRGKQTGDIAVEIRALPDGNRKIALALGLASRATEGDPGRDNLQKVTTTLSQALAETPIPDKDNQPASPYMELAGLVRYEGMTAGLDAPQLQQAMDLLAAQDAEIEKANFTLKDLQGKSWTLNGLRGKIVVVNFWATWCPPCRKEMPDLNALQARYASQGLVILSISDEEFSTVAPFIAASGYKPTVLLDPGHVVGKEFYVDGIPHTFVFNREGKLAAEAIDMRTMHQFLQMLAKAGLNP